ncbi:MAG: hypothetical protein KC561_10035, partial [Myxococcales bacterium]|nr:hypothetical protein [Myxococcales bacterium]
MQWRSDIRKGEVRLVAGAAATLFTVLAAHSMLETARDAMFLADLPATKLPWVYLAIAFASLLLSRLRLDRVERLHEATRLSGLLLASGGVTLGFWFLTSSASSTALYALYVWSGVLATLAVVQFWLLLSHLFTVDQA